MRTEPAFESVTTLNIPARPHRARWIIAIGVFKLLQAAAFLLLGFGALRLLHKDLLDVAEHWILALRFNPEGHFVSLLLGQVALIDPHRLRQISAAIFGIAALDAIEGAGLVLEKIWAEFVTLILTVSFLPLELAGVIRHPTWIRVGLAIINLAVVLYLLWFVRMRKRERRLR
ncbi:MAG TPA: DUF2127 domain-containing protein [Acidobacteriaceae bacterium]|nr:DUF2127 domain-containing protein [Acidobacteriaceae bacterium]